MSAPPFEEFEYEREYKYSVPFQYEGDYEKILQKALNSSKVIIGKTDIPEVLETVPSLAYLKKDEHDFMLKFNFKYEPIDLDGDSIKVKYPIIVKFFDNGLVDIRFDRLQAKFFSASTELYHRNLLLLKKWLSKNMHVNLRDIQMQTVVENITKNENNAVKYAQSMSSRTGGEATLKVNRDYVLPILGELKQLIVENQEIFDKDQPAKNLLEDFIEDIEETSDLPWISLCWKSEHKTNDLIVRFSFDYMREGYTLLQYQGLLRNVERMDRVVKCISENMA